MHPRILAAIAACTRTLVEAHDAGEPLAGAGAVTIGPLRATADRVALRRRFHDEAVHAGGRPTDPGAAALFDAIALARLDALGARWLAGIAKNLLEFPGPDEDGVRWLAFERISGIGVPHGQADAAQRTRAALPPALVDELSALSAALGDQAAFSAAAAAWCRRAVGVAPLPPGAAPGRGFQHPDRSDGRRRQARPIRAARVRA